MSLKSFLGKIQYGDNYDENYDEDDYDESIEDDYSSDRDDYDNYADEEDNNSKDNDYSQSSRTDYEQRKVRPIRMDRAVNNKVVPMKSSSRNLEVCIMKPTSFADSQDICDMLQSGRAAVVNLEGFDPAEAQRIMDFISGCIYAINGRLHQISRYIFIFSPESIDVSGDYLDLLPSEGFGVPTINKEF